MISLGKYVQNNLEFGRKLKRAPLVFGVNYFLRDKEGKFLNAVRDKHIWVKWMELRIHNDVGALKSPTGLIPKYDDLKELFNQVLNKEYSKEDYVKQFTIRILENLAKLDRVEKFHKENVPGAPSIIFEVFKEQRTRLLEAQEKFGDYVSPEKLEVESKEVTGYDK